MYQFYQQKKKEINPSSFQPLNMNHQQSLSTNDMNWDIIVPNNYPTIQQAINNASSQNGYNILVRPGTYQENIIIDTDGIILFAENKEETIIDGGFNGNVVTITSSYNELSGFTIQNSGSNNAGIFFDTCSGNQITDCIITNNQGNGLYFHQSYVNNITDNIINENQKQGIIISHNSLVNTITTNQIKNNQKSGIFIDNASRSNLIAGNNIESNKFGVKITNVSENNIVHHNEFINNEQNSYDNAKNHWYDSILDEGNYWDDYTGEDNDEDGIGDTPYTILGGENQDQYPLIEPISMNIYSIRQEQKSTDKTSLLLNSFAGQTIMVPNDYPTIQEAIDHAENGDTIKVSQGEYFENIYINKSLRLEGNSRENTVIDGGRKNHAIKIVSDMVTISNFKIRNTNNGFAGIRVHANHVVIDHNTITACGDGINIEGHSIQIKQNQINNNHFGIYLSETQLIDIENNSITQNTDGITLWSSSKITIHHNEISNNDFSGIFSLVNNNNTFQFNTIIENDEFGIQLYKSNTHTIENNSIQENDIGTSLSKSDEIIIKNNLINTNRDYGISLWFFSNKNIIEKNQITNHAGNGIRIDMSDDNIIKENDIYDNLNIAIQTTDSEELIIQSNTIKNNFFGGIYSYGLSDSIIEKNLIQSCGNQLFGSMLILFGFHNTIKDNIITNSNQGIFSFSYYSTFVNNTIKDGGNPQGGIGVLTDDSATIWENNSILNFGTGIGVKIENDYDEIRFVNNTIDNTAIALLLIADDEEDNTELDNRAIIMGNIILNNTIGIKISKKQNSVICQNHIKMNVEGIKIISAKNISITSNILENNMLYAIHFTKNAYTACNILHHNSFINNSLHISESNDNTYYNEVYGEGNYWDDYTGTDSDRDGIGDSPYQISETNEDKYPLMSPYQDDKEPVIMSMKPKQNHLYLFDTIKIPFLFTCLIGDIHIKISTGDDQYIDHVTFKINGKTKSNDFYPPYSYLFNEEETGIYKLKVYIYDNTGHMISERRTIYKIL